MDLRDAYRALKASPLVAAVAILSLALGIGATTAIFSILNSLLLKPLPVRDPHQLILVAAGDPPEGVSVSYRAWQAIRDQRLLDRPFAWATDRIGLTGAGETSSVEAIWATGNYFEVLGVQASVGRTFTEDDDKRGGGAGGPVAVISDRMWRARFGRARDIIGRTVTLERVRFTIIGVTPPDFLGLNVGLGFDVILPVETEPLLARAPVRLESPFWPWLQIMARLATGQTPGALTDVVRTAQPAIRATTMPPYARAEDRDRYLGQAWTAQVAPAGVSRFRRQYGPALLTLLGVVGLVLLVACANIATLMLARTASRRHEFSVRLALGSSRSRLVRQLLIESLLMSAVGAALGLALAQWGGRLLVEQLSTWAYTAVLDLSPDWRVLGVTAAATVGTAMLFGTAAGWRTARAEPADALVQHQRGISGEAGFGVSGWLVVVQVALSLLLVVGAGLFLRSFVALAYRDLGFDRGRVLVAILDVRRTTVPASGRVALYERIREAVSAVPGVESASTSFATPLGSSGVRYTPEVTEPGNAAFNGQAIRILTNPVGPDWFRTFGTRLLAGRDFLTSDTATAHKVAVVNQAFTRRYFNGDNPLGRTLIAMTSPTDRRPLEVVGLVEDAAFTSVREPVEPIIYTPFAQGVDEQWLATVPLSVTVRAAPGVPPARLGTSVGEAIGNVDPDLSVSFQTVTDQLNVFYIRERLLALISGFFGAVALLLAGVGLYGVISYSVSRRRMEIGIRMALGADARGVVRLVFGRVVWLAGLGAVAGAIMSLLAARFVQTQLFELNARDPLTFVTAAIVLALVAGLAGWLPARRAARLDPATVLREG
jgi:predicted permease